MRVGFTGTRAGLTAQQLLELNRWFSASVIINRLVSEFHHGCCVGADGSLAEIAHARREPGMGYLIHAHPSDIPALTDEAALASADVTHPVRPPLDRNRDIVDACDLLLACPDGPERQRSGTWATVRYARKKRKRVVVFWPDGSVGDSAPQGCPPGLTGA